jgi:catalase
VAQVTPFLKTCKADTFKNINKYSIKYFKYLNNKNKRFFLKSKFEQVIGSLKSDNGQLHISGEL